MPIYKGSWIERYSSASQRHPLPQGKVPAEAEVRPHTGRYKPFPNNAD